MTSVGNPDVSRFLQMTAPVTRPRVASSKFVSVRRELLMAGPSAECTAALGGERRGSPDLGMVRA